MMVAAPLSTFLYSNHGPWGCVYCLALAPLVLVIPFILFLREDKPLAIRTLHGRLNDIWETVKSRSVWQPMAFVSNYAA